MRYLLFAFALFVANPAVAGQVVLECSGYYPEVESPESTTIIAEIVRESPSGRVIGMRCSVTEGDPVDTCNINDGACCACNVARGFTPECSVTVEFVNAQTAGHCLAMYPPCYYGNGCPPDVVPPLVGDMTPPFVDTPAVVRQMRHKRPARPPRLPRGFR